MTDKRTLLVIDDDIDVCEYVCHVSEICNYNSSYINNASKIDDALENSPNIIVLDLVMPNMDGIEVLRMLSDKKIDSGIILSSGFDQRVLKSAAMLANELGLNILGLLNKPFRLDEIKALLEKQQLFSPSKNSSSFQVDLEKIDVAIKQNQFQVYFQPKINLATGNIVGCEALTRWIHPEAGMIPPINFIPFAEQSGQINEITRIVIEQGLEMLNNLDSVGYKLRLAINVPANLLVDIGFTDKLMEKLNNSNIDADAIIIEVTESDVMNELSSGLDVVTRLRMKGVHLSIDDFGTGHSSMERLATIPFTELKLDKSFIDALTDDSTRKIIISSIKLGHELGMSVIAEGVEDIETYQDLQSLGCDEVQGYFIAKPMPPHEFIEWLKAFNSDNNEACARQ